jgi:hypothetical protein
MSPAEVAQLFAKTFVPVGDAPALLGYSNQYGRRLILLEAIEGQDLFDVNGRWFVSRAFLEQLAAERA